MRKMLFVDYDKCTGCEICVLRCSFEKTETFNPVRSRVNIIRWDEKGLHIPTMCQHCEVPYCMLACPVDAITKDEESGTVLKDSEVCIGCKMCMMVCPFGAPSFDHVEGKVVMCDLCEGEPACAKVCPTGAIQFLAADNIALMKKRQGMKQLANLVTLAVGETSGKEASK